MRMRGSAVSAAAIANSAANAAQAIPVLMAAELPLDTEVSAANTKAETTSSPPIPPDRSFSILRI